MLKAIARARVPLGFACAILALWLARPDTASLGVGALIVLAGEALRVWASGHIDKGREVTRTGPYRFVRHPLYLGSSIMAAGFIIASRSVIVAGLVAAYMVVTLVAAMRSEEAALEARFGGEYSAYRDGTAPPVQRAFSIEQVRANREYRAMIGVVVGMAILYLRSRL